MISFRDRDREMYDTLFYLFPLVAQPFVDTFTSDKKAENESIKQI
jgi:hypothetical protein